MVWACTLVYGVVGSGVLGKEGRDSGKARSGSEMEMIVGTSLLVLGVLW